MRKLRGLTQEELAKKAGVSKLTVLNIETGETQNPSVETLSSLAAVLATTTDDLLGIKRSHHPAQAQEVGAELLSAEEFLDRAKGVLEENDRKVLNVLRTRLNLGRATMRSWLSTVMDLREEAGIGATISKGGGKSS
jgi:transcriptional regulator with XRE-family HTH domain